MKPRRSGPEPEPPLYAMVVPGLESVAGDEITRDVGGQVARTLPGFVVFRVSVVDQSVLRLRTTEDVFLLAWGTDELTYRAQDLDRIRRWTAHDAPWERLLRIHHSIRPKPRGKPTFRIVTQMTGAHGYRRIDAQKALVRGLEGKLPASWRHADEGAAVEIWLSINGATAVCGLRLSDRSMRHRDYKHEHIAASLRPTVAAAMVRLAGIKPGHVVLDPMSGAGTILAEVLERGRRFGTGVSSYGGDLNVSALRAARANLRGLGTIAWTQWNATRLPLPDHFADRIISNAPFGKRHGTPETLGVLYEAMVAEYARVLKPRGRAVLLVSDLVKLQRAAKYVSWKLDSQLRVRILGQPAHLSVWRNG